MADAEEGATAPNQRQGQNLNLTKGKDGISKINSNRIKMQQDSNIYI